MKFDRPTIIYDGECPVCSSYVQFYRLKETLGKIDLKNARDDTRLAAAIKAEGFDLNEGMIFYNEGRAYHGADAVNAMALMSSGSGLANSLNAWIFKSKSRSDLLYPVLRAGRNALLRLLGRKPL